MNSAVNAVRRFGTAPVFITAISTILGAILFLRFVLQPEASDSGVLF